MSPTALIKKFQALVREDFVFATTVCKAADLSAEPGLQEVFPINGEHVALLRNRMDVAVVTCPGIRTDIRCAFGLNVATIPDVVVLEKKTMEAWIRHTNEGHDARVLRTVDRLAKKLAIAFRDYGKPAELAAIALNYGIISHRA